MKNLNDNRLIKYSGNIIFIYCLLLIAEVLFRQYSITNETENPLINKSVYNSMYELYYLGGAILAVGSIVNFITKLMKWHLISLIIGLILITSFYLTINGVIGF